MPKQPGHQLLPTCSWQKEGRVGHLCGLKSLGASSGQKKSLETLEKQMGSISIVDGTGRGGVCEASDTAPVAPQHVCHLLCVVGGGGLGFHTSLDLGSNTLHATNPVLETRPVENLKWMTMVLFCLVLTYSFLNCSFLQIILKFKLS